ncbi:MAG: hypothetical protein R8K46_09630 [Mariprofundaceae bacterium]
MKNHAINSLMLVFLLSSVLAGCTTAISPPSVGIEVEKEITFPLAVEKVWYRTEKIRLLGLAWEETGSLTVNEDSIQFKHDKGKINIPRENIQKVVWGKLSPDIINDWVIVYYTDSGKDAVAAFKSAPFSGGESKIYSAILHIMKTTTLGQKSVEEYSSPLDNFSVPIPEGVGRRVQDENDKDGGSVSFHDDFGNLKSIFYIRLSPETLKIQNDPEKQRANLKSFLNDFAMSRLFMPISPNASILYQEPTHLGEDNAYFAIVDIPGGSTMFDVKAKKGYDTKRGLFIFVRGKFIYMLSSGENPKVFDLGGVPKSLDKLMEQEKGSLLSFSSEITFK